MAYRGLLNTWSRVAYYFKMGSDLVLESDEAYTRNIYHLHQEQEFTVPFIECMYRCREFLKMYEDMYLANLKQPGKRLIRAARDTFLRPPATTGHDRPGRDYRAAGSTLY